MVARSAASTASFVLLLLLVVVPSSSNHVKLPVHGNVFPVGEFYVSMHLGAPPREYNLHVDTGSTFTWVQCRVPQPKCDQTKHCSTWPQQYHPYLYNLIPEKLVISTDALCVELVQHRPAGNPRDPTCHYKLHYAGGESTEGFLVRDELKLQDNNGHQTIAFGCGFNQAGGVEGRVSPSDGVLGLGRGPSVPVVSQLKRQHAITKNVISHCFSTRGGGSLVIGEESVPSAVQTWVALDPKTQQGHYSPVVSASLHFQGNPITAKQAKVIFDSGATYTYFDKELYESAVHAVKASLGQRSQLTEVKDPAMVLCWRGPRRFRSVHEVKPLFKTFALVFSTHGNNRASTFEMPPENYLMISGHGNVCFGILENPFHQGTLLIGAIAMQDRIMVYDNEQGRIGWTHDSCGTTGSEITSRL